jgi:hypothetical protein
MIYFLCGARRIVDGSSGWGDRGIAAMIWDRYLEQVGADRLHSYTGYDPNTLLHPRYEQIKQAFVPHNTDRDKFTFLAQQFELAELNEPIDCYFSCPPYFDLESFTTPDDTDNTAKQSIMQYPVLEDWVYSFLLTPLRKVSDRLVKGSMLCLVIGDVFGPTYRSLYVESTVLALTHLEPTLFYRGALSYAGSDRDNHRAIFMWQKYDKPINPDFRDSCAQSLKQWYPKLWQRLRSENHT